MLEITIPGKPVPKGRPRFRKVGNFVSAYTDEKTMGFENMVAWIAKQSLGNRQPTDQAVSVRCEFDVTPPASWSNKKKQQAIAGLIFPVTRPDSDNLVKAIYDGMNKVVYLDDKQIVDGSFSKRYADRDETRVWVRLMA